MSDIDQERRVALAAYLAVGLAIVNIAILMMLGIMILRGVAV